MTTPEESRAKAHAWFEETTVYPTRECFCDVVRYFNQAVETGVAIAYLEATFVIVHGICLLDDGRPYAHAWIERAFTNTVTLCGIHRGQTIYFSVNRDDFRRQAYVYQETRYTLPEHIELSEATGAGGPWLPEYLELCNDHAPGDLEVCCFCGRETRCGYYMRGEPSDGKFCRHPDAPFRHSPCGLCIAMRGDWRRYATRRVGQ